MSVGLALAAAMALQGTPADVPSTADAVPVDVRLGRDDGCAVNPPLLFVASEAVRIEPGTGYDLARLSAAGQPVRIIAFGPAHLFGDGGEDSVTLAIDELSVRSGELTSATGEAWKLFDRAGSGAASRLVPKAGDYSLCRHAGRATRGFRIGVPQHGWDSRTGLPRRRGVQAMLSAGASAVLDIFGLNAGSFVRVRLTSQPSDAEIYLGGARQPPRTNTVLDVIAAELPHLRLVKPGFEPCVFSRWTTAFEPRSNNRVLNASCRLVPSKQARSGR